MRFTEALSEAEGDLSRAVLECLYCGAKPLRIVTGSTLAILAECLECGSEITIHRARHGRFAKKFGTSVDRQPPVTPLVDSPLHSIRCPLCGSRLFDTQGTDFVNDVVCWRCGSELTIRRRPSTAEPSETKPSTSAPATAGSSAPSKKCAG